MVFQPNGLYNAVPKKGYVTAVDPAVAEGKPARTGAWRINVKSGVEPIVRWIKRSKNPGAVTLRGADDGATMLYTELVKASLASKTTV